jgi:hypothetical protein
VGKGLHKKYLQVAVMNDKGKVFENSRINNDQVCSINKSWHDYNESLIERGRILMDISFLGSSNRDKEYELG